MVKSKKTQRQKGGASQMYGFDKAPSHYETFNNPMVQSRVDQSNAVYRPTGYLPSMNGHGLPGVQSGGRYEFVGGEAVHIPCEGSRSAIPSSSASGSLNVRGGELWSQAGGAQQYVPSSVSDAYVPGDVNGGEASLTVPTARYENLPYSHPFDKVTSGNLMVTSPLARGGSRKTRSKSKSNKSKSRPKSRSKSKSRCSKSKK
jgi:hypothetical protein